MISNNKMQTNKKTCTSNYKTRKIQITRTIANYTYYTYIFYVLTEDNTGGVHNTVLIWSALSSDVAICFTKTWPPELCPSRLSSIKFWSFWGKSFSTINCFGRGWCSYTAWYNIELDVRDRFPALLKKILMQHMILIYNNLYYIIEVKHAKVWSLVCSLSLVVSL